MCAMNLIGWPFFIVVAKTLNDNNGDNGTDKVCKKRKQMYLKHSLIYMFTSAIPNHNIYIYSSKTSAGATWMVWLTSTISYHIGKPTIIIFNCPMRYVRLQTINFRVLIAKTWAMLYHWTIGNTSSGSTFTHTRTHGLWVTMGHT